MFTRAFVNFQNSNGCARPSSEELLSRTPFVYVPWSITDTVLFKDAHGRANRHRPYLQLLADPQHVYRPDQTFVESMASAPPFFNSALQLQLRFPRSLLVQAAAAARISGKDDILKASEKGNVELVKDHLTVDAACVHKKNE